MLKSDFYVKIGFLSYKSGLLCYKSGLLSYKSGLVSYKSKKKNDKLVSPYFYGEFSLDEYIIFKWEFAC